MDVSESPIRWTETPSFAERRIGSPLPQLSGFGYRGAPGSPAEALAVSDIVALIVQRMPSASQAMLLLLANRFMLRHLSHIPPIVDAVQWSNPDAMRLFADKPATMLYDAAKHPHPICPDVGGALVTEWRLRNATVTDSIVNGNMFAAQRLSISSCNWDLDVLSTLTHLTFHTRTVAHSGSFRPFVHLVYLSVSVAYIMEGNPVLDGQAMRENPFPTALRYLSVDRHYLNLLFSPFLALPNLEELVVSGHLRGAYDHMRASRRVRTAPVLRLTATGDWWGPPLGSLLSLFAPAELHFRGNTDDRATRHLRKALNKVRYAPSVRVIALEHAEVARTPTLPHHSTKEKFERVKKHARQLVDDVLACCVAGPFVGVREIWHLPPDPLPGGQVQIMRTDYLALDNCRTVSVYMPQQR